MNLYPNGMNFKTYIVAAIFVCPLTTSAQYRGGSNDGFSNASYSTQNATPNIARGGSNDGHSGVLVSSQNETPSIFHGGTNDGFASGATLNQNRNPSIYLGGTNDGWGSTSNSNANLNPSIYFGGANDGFAQTVATAQNSNPEIYFGGVNDGMATLTPAAKQNGSPEIYTGGANDGFDMSIKLRQNSSFPLPISLLNFSGQWFNDDALISWQVNWAEGLDHFELERSEDGGLNYSLVATIAPNPDVSQLDYRFTDVRAWQLPTDLLLYRLKLVEKQGKFSYSGIAKLRKDKAAPAFAAYPNPTSGRLSLVLMNVTDYSAYSYQVSSRDGKLLLRAPVTGEKTAIDLSRNPAGAYILMLFSKDIPVQYFTIILNQ